MSLFHWQRFQSSIMRIILITILILLIQSAVTKVYTRCGLTKELLKQGFPRSFVGHWVCLIESESGKDTSKMTNRANGGKSLGLFQINSKEWCTFERPGGKCNIKCEDLLNEDISDDSKCAKRVHGELGFRGWDGWRRSCYRRNLSIPIC